MTPLPFAPKRRSWMRGAAIVGAASIAAYAAGSYFTDWAPGRFGGLAFGTAAAAMFFLDALYPLRRRLMAWPLRTAQNWLQFHLYGGVLACLFVALHVGFRAPGGAMGWWLASLTAWACVSGLAGVWLQKYIPSLLANELNVEAIYERIPELAGRLQHDADALVAGSPDVLQRFYDTSVRADLEKLRPSWTAITGFRAELARRMAPFEALGEFLAPADRARLSGLQNIVTEKLELEVQFGLQRILKQWVVVHSIPCIALLALIVVHVAAVIAY